MIAPLGDHAGQQSQENDDCHRAEYEYDQNDPGEYIKDAHDVALIADAEQGWNRFVSQRVVGKVGPRKFISATPDMVTGAGTKVSVGESTLR
jgi:hypothetical protein